MLTPEWDPISVGEEHDDRYKGEEQQGAYFTPGNTRVLQELFIFK